MTTLAALSDPVRRDLVAALVVKDCSVGELVDRVGLSQPAVSKHLKVLRDAGLAHVRVDAQRRIYTLNPAPLSDLELWLAAQRAIWERRLDRLGEHLDHMAEKEKR